MECQERGRGLSIDDVPFGTYYIYAAVFNVGSMDLGVLPGDYLGVCEGKYPDDIPNAPNAIITKTNRIFNITLYKIQYDIATGTYKATCGFGGFDIIVNPEASHITKIAYHFSDWTMGNVTYNGGITITSGSGWAITDGQFTIKNDLASYPQSGKWIEIQGTFGADGISATGTWNANYGGVTDSGTWEATWDSEQYLIIQC